MRAGVDGATRLRGRVGGRRQQHQRALGYAAALGLAERAADELPIVPEDDRLAWSNATGEWHVVRVRYPFRPGYGRHPALMLVVGLVVGAGLLWLQQFFLDVARGDALQGIAEDFPDQADLIEDVGLVLAAVAIVPLLWMVWLVIAGAFDLLSTIERQGRRGACPAAAARRAIPPAVAPTRPARPLRPVHRRRRRQAPTVSSAWLSNERTAVPQGPRAG